MSDGTIGALCGDISVAAMMGDLAEFARRVKLSGTPEELESFRYIQSRLDAAGFRTEMLSHDAYISLPGAATLTVGNERLACITHSFSRPSAPGGTRGSLMYLPGGIGPESDVRGRIVVLDGIASPAAGLRATQAGAIGQIHVSPHEHKHEMCISSVWGSPTPENLGQLPGAVVISIARADGVALQQRLLAGEEIVAEITAEVETGWRKTPILVAEMAPPGDDPDAPFVLFSGHHDTWYYGVMDNGSANATMMEVARLCASRRDQWRRGLRLCFWSGHSHGRYSGSSWYADQNWHELERRCVAHVNIDSTGAVGATVLTDVLTSLELRGMGGEAVQRQAGQDIVGMRMSRAGDQSFWGIGVPSMFMGMSEQSSETSINPTGAVLGGGSKRNGAGFGWWWHTPDDTLDKIDFQHMDQAIAAMIGPVPPALAALALPPPNCSPHMAPGWPSSISTVKALSVPRPNSARGISASPATSPTRPTLPAPSAKRWQPSATSTFSSTTRASPSRSRCGTSPRKIGTASRT